MLAGPELAPVLELAERTARAGLHTVLEGETGTGKELLARAMHVWSERKGPFVAVNCAALPDSLAEAELFGYRRGAFTGAAHAHVGHLRSAHRGTLLLDEIPRLSLPLQAKLLRVLDQHEVVPLGETVPVPVDALVVAATQRPLGELTADGTFTRDLQMRLEGATLSLPPLRQRRQEMGFLLGRLLERHGAQSPPALQSRLVEALCLYDWPGNLRELDWLVHRLVKLHGHRPSLGLSELPPHIAQPSGSPEPAAEGRDRSEKPPATMTQDGTKSGKRQRPTKESLAHALRVHEGNIQRAADEVGMRRQDFYRFFSKSELAAFRGSRGSRGGSEQG
jgi:transcriptional regulator with PAS, ATPase and Fis domain